MDIETKLSQEGALRKYDERALTGNEQTNLNEIKIKCRIASEKYLRDHPEIRTMISEFVSTVLKKRPDDIKEFAADFFSDPDLKERYRSSPKQ